MPNDLLPAYRTFFGVPAWNPALLDGLEPIQLKRLYHRRALETHPDRARARGGDPAVMTQRFQDVTAAYEVLHAYLVARRAPSTRAASPRSEAPRSTAASSSRPAAGVDRAARAPRPASARAHRGSCPDHFWSGHLPERGLLLGQFLYYSGRISWQSFIAAIQWQRRQRPCFGRLAVARGFLAESAVRAVLRAKRFEERTGDAAVRLGRLTARDRDLVVAAQRRQQRRLGDYFLDAGLLSADELLAAAVAQKAHNRRWARLGHLG